VYLVASNFYNWLAIFHGELLEAYDASPDLLAEFKKRRKEE